MVAGLAVFAAKILAILIMAVLCGMRLLRFGWFFFFIGSESFVIQALAFALFRFLDAIKPWPINRVDRYFKRNAHANTVRAIIWQGFGIIADDLLAAFFTIVLILLGMRLF